MAELDADGNYVLDAEPAASVAAPTEEIGGYVLDAEPTIKTVTLAPGVPSVAWVGRPLRAPVESSQYGADYLNIKNKNMAGTSDFFESILPDSSDIPFIGDVVSATDSVGVLGIAKRMKAGEDVSDDDLIKFNTYLEQSNRDRDRTWMGDLAVLSRKLVSYGAEFAGWTALMATGVGAVPAGSGAAISAEKKLAAVAADATLKNIARYMATSGIKREAMHNALKDASKGVIKGVLGDKWGSVALQNVGGAAVASAAEGAGLLAVNKSLEKLTSMALGQDEIVTKAGLDRQLDLLSQGKDPDSAFWDTLGSDFFEYQSEMMGPYLAKTGGLVLKATGIAKRMPGIKEFGIDFGTRLRDKITAQMGARGGKAVQDALARAATGSLIAKMATHMPFDGQTIGYFARMAGHNGMLEEMAEERYGGFMQGLLGIQGDEWGVKNAFDQMIPPLDDLGKEAALFALPTLLGMGAHAALMSKRLGGTGFGLVRYLDSLDRIRADVKSKAPDAPVIFNETKEGMLQALTQGNLSAEKPLTPEELKIAADTQYAEKKAKFEADAQKRGVYETQKERDDLVNDVLDHIMFAADTYRDTSSDNRIIKTIRAVLAPMQSLANFNWREAEYGQGGNGYDRAAKVNGFEGELVQSAAAIKRAFKTKNITTDTYDDAAQERDADTLARTIIGSSLSKRRAEKVLALETPEQIAAAKASGAVSQVVGLRNGQPYRTLVYNPKAAITADIRKQMQDQGLITDTGNFSDMATAVNATSMSGEDMDVILENYFKPAGKRDMKSVGGLYVMFGLNPADASRPGLLEATMKTLKAQQTNLYGGSFGAYSKANPGNVLRFSLANNTFAATFEETQDNETIRNLSYHPTKEMFDQLSADHRVKFGHQNPGLNTGARKILLRTGAMENWDHGDGTRGMVVSLLDLRDEYGNTSGGLGAAYSINEDAMEAAMRARDPKMADFAADSKSAPMELLRGLLEQDADGKSYLDRRVEQLSKEWSVGNSETEEEHAGKMEALRAQVQDIIENDTPVQRRELFVKTFLHQTKGWAPAKFLGNFLHNHLGMSKETSLIGDVSQIDSVRWAPAAQYISDSMASKYGTSDLDWMQSPFEAYQEEAAKAEKNAVKDEKKKAKGPSKKSNAPAVKGKSKEQQAAEDLLGAREDDQGAEAPPSQAEVEELREAVRQTPVEVPTPSKGETESSKVTAKEQKPTAPPVPAANVPVRELPPDSILVRYDLIPNNLRQLILPTTGRLAPHASKVAQLVAEMKKSNPLISSKVLGAMQELAATDSLARSVVRDSIAEYVASITGERVVKAAAQEVPERSLAEEASKARMSTKRAEAVAADKWLAEQKARIDAERAAKAAPVAGVPERPGVIGTFLDKKALAAAPLSMLQEQLISRQNDYNFYSQSEGIGSDSLAAKISKEIKAIKAELARREAQPAAPVAKSSRKELEALSDQELVARAPDTITAPTTRVYDVTDGSYTDPLAPAPRDKAAVAADIKRLETEIATYENVLECMGNPKL